MAYSKNMLKLYRIIGSYRVTRIAFETDYQSNIVTADQTIVSDLDMRINAIHKVSRHNFIDVIIVVSINGDKIGMAVDSISDVVTLLWPLQH
jgi:chemotaxis signal transduction protein